VFAKYIRLYGYECMDRVEDSIINEMSNVLKYGMQIIIHVRF